MFRSALVILSLASVLATGCVTETVPEEPPAGTPLFSFPLKNPSRLMEAGSYHGTILFFEIDLQKDLSPEWATGHEELQLQLPFIVPKIDRQREIYEVGGIHTVVLRGARWEVGDHRFPLRDRSRLYVFKEIPGAFRFSFRGQEIVVESERSWIPAVYYYLEETDLEAEAPSERRPRTTARRRQVTREVVQVGVSTIELFPQRREWLVNGNPFDFDPERPLFLKGSVRYAPPADRAGRLGTLTPRDTSR